MSLREMHPTKQSHSSLVSSRASAAELVRQSPELVEGDPSTPRQMHSSSLGMTPTVPEIVPSRNDKLKSKYFVVGDLAICGLSRLLPVLWSFPFSCQQRMSSVLAREKSHSRQEVLPFRET